MYMMLLSLCRRRIFNNFLKIFVNLFRVDTQSTDLDDTMLNFELNSNFRG